MDVDAVDLYIVIRADQNVLNPADDPGLHQIGPGRINLDYHIGGFYLKVFVVDVCVLPSTTHA